MIHLPLSHDVELRAAAASRSQARGRPRGVGVFAGARRILWVREDSSPSLGGGGAALGGREEESKVET